MLIERGCAKINLYLRIVGRRDDGYHLLDSLFVFAAVHDLLEVGPAETLTLQVGGPFGGALEGDAGENLVLRAARLLQETSGSAAGAAIRLVKNLPLASGLGGGSADAAATLRALNRLWRLDYSPMELAALGEKLGADVPAAIRSQPVRVGGIGDILTPAPVLPEFSVVLVNPGVALSTPRVFRAWAEANQTFAAPLADQPPPDFPGFVAWLQGVANDLEAPAQTLAPEITAVLAALERTPGAALARMSGSGATCFALYADPERAQAAAVALARAHGWWTWAGALTTAHPAL